MENIYHDVLQNDRQQTTIPSFHKIASKENWQYFMKQVREHENKKQSFHVFTQNPELIILAHKIDQHLKSLPQYSFGSMTFYGAYLSTSFSNIKKRLSPPTTASHHNWGFQEAAMLHPLDLSLFLSKVQKSRELKFLSAHLLDIANIRKANTMYNNITKNKWLILPDNPANRLERNLSHQGIAIFNNKKNTFHPNKPSLLGASIFGNLKDAKHAARCAYGGESFVSYVEVEVKAKAINGANTPLFLSEDMKNLKSSLLNTQIHSELNDTLLQKDVIQKSHKKM